MGDVKIFIVIVSNLLLIGADSLYIKGVLNKKIVPHSFSWLVWSCLTGVGFAAQLAGKAGIGAIILGLNSALCITIFLISLKYGVKKFFITDWFCLAGALLGLVAWQLTSNPLWASVTVSITDFLAILPTYRKIYSNPFQDSPLPFGIGLIGYCLNLFTFSSYSLTTVLLPAVIIFNDSIYVLLILIRKKVLNKQY